MKQKPRNIFDFTTSVLTTNDEFTLPLIGIRIGHKLTGMVRCLNGILAVGDACRPTQCASTIAQHRPRFRQPRRRARDADAADPCSGPRGLGAPHSKASSPVLGWSSAPEAEREPRGRKPRGLPFCSTFCFLFSKKNILLKVLAQDFVWSCWVLLSKTALSCSTNIFCSANILFLAEQNYYHSC